MKDGIYHVRFLSNRKGVGEGIAVFKEGSVNGGDSGYTYSRSKQGDGAGFTTKLTIKRWDPGSESVFGGLDQFELVFRGDATDARFSANGSIVGRSEATLVVEGRYLTPAL
ncbi:MULTISPECIES: GrlR family regulatory protein [Stenotrophomonas]|uniref:T3SS negative regulator,GrlR n=1 Tax=Stenotrophomonas maltophilia TaxID=40324 RepID=A0A246HM74_STEMA|nr:MULTISPECIES: GrlR family regulatory protein [Stenotrophomonas]OWQ52518.1 hypothetical protein CEE60_12300 [Stenotrophomonas maltophilia]TGY33654.1 hypothetical protein E5352_12005 [Stenotrophomonas maltophilia]